MVSALISYSIRGVYLVLCTFAPFFSTAAFMVTLRMNDSLRYNTKYQNGCLISTVALPFSFFITCYYQYKYSDQKFGLYISLLPLVPVLSFFINASLFYKDFKDTTPPPTSTKTKINKII